MPMLGLLCRNQGERSMFHICLDTGQREENSLRGQKNKKERRREGGKEGREGGKGEGGRKEEGN